MAEGQARKETSKLKQRKKQGDINYEKQKVHL